MHKIIIDHEKKTIEIHLDDDNVPVDKIVQHYTDKGYQKQSFYHSVQEQFSITNSTYNRNFDIGNIELATQDNRDDILYLKSRIIDLENKLEAYVRR